MKKKRRSPKGKEDRRVSPKTLAERHYRLTGFDVADLEHPAVTKGGKEITLHLYGFASLMCFSPARKITALVSIVNSTRLAGMKNKILESTKAREWLNCGNQIFIFGAEENPRAGRPSGQAPNYITEEIKITKDSA